MSQFHLPAETVEFLSAGMQLHYDPSKCYCGAVKLKRLDELVLEEVWLESDSESDPNLENEGYYAIPAISLTGECKSYDPAFILLWLPNEKLFGTWDNDHWVLEVFRNASWSDIVETPEIYLGAQWDHQSKMKTQFDPSHSYELKPGRPF